MSTSTGFPVARRDNALARTAASVLSLSPLCRTALAGSAASRPTSSSTCRRSMRRRDCGPHSSARIAHSSAAAPRASVWCREKTPAITRPSRAIAPVASPSALMAPITANAARGALARL